MTRKEHRPGGDPGRRGELLDGGSLATQYTAGTDIAAEHQTAERAGLPFLAAILDSSAAHVVSVLNVLTPDTVALLDKPCATILDVAHDLSRRGIDPTPTLVAAEALRAGVFVGHAGDLARTRLTDAVTTRAQATALPLYAADLAATVWRVRMMAAGDAIRGWAVAGAEDDAWAGFCAAGVELRRLKGIVDELRTHIGQVAS